MNAPVASSLLAGATQQADITQAEKSVALASVARSVLEARRKLERICSGEVPRDAAWDMMLELFIARQTGRLLCVKELTLLCGTSPAGAVRRLDRLQTAGLICRKTDGQDHRRIQVDLTVRGFEAMQAILEDMAMVTR